MNTYRLTETSNRLWEYEIDIVTEDGAIWDTDYVVLLGEHYANISHRTDTANGTELRAKAWALTDGDHAKVEEMADKFWNDTLHDEALEMAREWADVEATRREAEQAIRG